MPNIRFQCSDNKFLHMDLEMAKVFEPVATLVNTLGAVNDQETLPIAVAHGIMEKVAEWVEHHRNDPPQTEPEDFEEARTLVVSSWDKKFLEVDLDTLYDLINAADFLNVPGLLDLTCHAVAQMVKAKSTEEIREIFNIQNDFTPEDEEKMRIATRWYITD